MVHSRSTSPTVARKRRSNSRDRISRDHDRKRDRDRRRRRSRDVRRRSVDRDRRHRRSRSWSNSRSRSRSGSRGKDKNGKPKSQVPDKPNIADSDLQGKSPDEQEMMKMMGFCSFDSTKGKKVAGNEVGTVHVILKRKYRQYMNRKGGFNRPLDFVA